MIYAHLFSYLAFFLLKAAKNASAKMRFLLWILQKKEFSLVFNLKLAGGVKYEMLIGEM